MAQKTFKNVYKFKLAVKDTGQPLSHVFCFVYNSLPNIFEPIKVYIVTLEQGVFVERHSICDAILSKIHSPHCDFAGWMNSILNENTRDPRWMQIIFTLI